MEIFITIIVLAGILVYLKRDSEIVKKGAAGIKKVWPLKKLQ